MTDNVILLTDSYKNSHAAQYPRGTSRVTSYLAPRVGAAHSTVRAAGFQGLIKRYLRKPITMADIEEAATYFPAHMGSFDRAKWEYIVRVHGGRLPIVIYAVPEGGDTPIGAPIMVVENTDPQCWWLTNYLETLLVQVWYPTTVATRSAAMREHLHRVLVLSGDPTLLPFKLHDFGTRGVESMDAAAIGGAAHLMNFLGTDNVPALVYLRKYYGADIAGYSIDASEHSTITSWGQQNETAAYANMIDLYGDRPLYACVSDSYDFMAAVSHRWGGELKERVLAAKGTLVIRPDSGEPTEVLPEALRRLEVAFGATMNDKGFKVLHPKVRLIQGDHVEEWSIREMLLAVLNAGYSIDNVAFGSGGGLLQKLNRDTERFAFKCAEVVVNGEVIGVQKLPKTDLSKASIKGRDALFAASPTLREIYRDGLLEIDESWSTIVARAAL